MSASAGKVAADLPADAAARERAATDFAQNLCVTAGAGCGKTSLLVERVLFALLARGTRLERIVAITFTTKAAAQMRARVVAALVEIQRALAEATSLRAALEKTEKEAHRTLARLAAQREPPDLATLRARAAAALDAEPAMTTIHSFALGLLARHPVEADLPADLAMDLGDGFRRHASSWLPRLVESGLADPARTQPEGEALARTLERLTLGDLSELARAAAWLPEAIPDRPADPLATLRPRLAELRDALAATRRRVPPLAKAHNLVDQWDLLLAALEEWIGARTDAQLPLPATPALDELLDKTLSKAKLPALDEPTLAAVREQLADAQRVLKKLRRVDESFAADVVRAARTLGRELAESFARGGFLPADGALARAAALLARDADVRRAESAAFELLLVDEFQDTDPLQCEIVLRLCQPPSDPPALPLDEVQLAPGRLFLVGDPKQSIYRFRGADLEMFARARRLLLAQGGSELLLTTNFRSRPAILRATNQLFERWIGPANDYEPDYVALVAQRQPAPSDPTPVELWTVLPKASEPDAFERRAAEGRAIAQEIAALHARGTGYGQVAILLRGLGILPAYVQPLRDRAIPFVVAGGKSFVQRSEVGELASLLLAAADPDDEVACLGALRSTLLAVADADLEAAVAAAKRLRWPLLLQSPVAAVARAARELERLHALVAAAPAADAVERIVEATLLLPVSAAARDGEQRIANLRKLAAQAVARAEETGLPLAPALRDLLTTHEHVDGEAERSLADEEIDAVRILTIHKAKGLEFEVVFVGDLARERRGPSGGDAELRALQTPHGPRAALSIPALDVGNVADVERSERERRHEEAEGKRLLYVACTRAQERLILVSSAAADASAPWIEPLAALGYAPAPAGASTPADGPLAAGVHHRAIAEPARLHEPLLASVADGAELSAAAERHVRAVVAARAPANAFARPSDAETVIEPAAASSGGRDGGEAGDEAAAALARALGSACHYALAASGAATPPSDGQIDAAAARAAADGGCDARELARATRELLRAAPARALQKALAGVRVVATELPLLLARDGRTWRGSADLLFEEGGDLVVGDWKSDRSDDAAELAQRHRPQLAIYRDALTTALRLARPPRMELLLLRAGRRQVL